MKINKVYFEDFLNGIRLTKSQKKASKSGHEVLRERLRDYEPDVVVDTFLQGSYRRATAVRPQKNQLSDVDIVVVTNLDETEFTPQAALEYFEPFLDKYYAAKYTQQSRSYQIRLSEVELDFVVTSAPSEAFKKEAHNELSAIGLILKSSDMITEMDAFTQKGSMGFIWETPGESEVLSIPDRDSSTWEKTNPIAQIVWTQDKNKKCNGHYVNVVKAIKWWQRINQDNFERPKGYPLEHIIGDNCPDGIESVEDGIIATFRAIKENYAFGVSLGWVPKSRDRGVEANVLARISAEQFSQFLGEVERVCEVLDKIEQTDDECEAIRLWGDIFGDKFPKPPEKCNEESSRNTYGSHRTTGGRFA